MTYVSSENLKPTTNLEGGNGNSKNNSGKIQPSHGARVLIGFYIFGLIAWFPGWLTVMFLADSPAKADAAERLLKLYGYAPYVTGVSIGLYLLLVRLGLTRFAMMVLFAPFVNFIIFCILLVRF